MKKPKKAAPIAMLPNLEIGERIIIGQSIYEFSRIKEINSPNTKLEFVRVGSIKDEDKRGTGRGRVR